MKISEGNPPEPGRYVCYLPGVTVATVIRDWRDGRWFDVYKNPIAGKVAGWIGPLPEWSENRGFVPDARIFDL